MCVIQRFRWYSLLSPRVGGPLHQNIKHVRLKSMATWSRHNAGPAFLKAAQHNNRSKIEIFSSGTCGCRFGFARFFVGLLAASLPAGLSSYHPHFLVAILSPTQTLCWNTAPKEISPCNPPFRIRTRSKSDPNRVQIRPGGRRSQRVGAGGLGLVEMAL